MTTNPSLSMRALGRVPAFHGASKEALRALQQGCSDVIEAHPGDRIFTQWEPLKGLVVLLKGAVSIDSEARQKAVHFGLIYPGDILGEFEYLRDIRKPLTDRSASVSATAIVDCRYVLIAPEVLRNTVLEDHQLSISLNGYIADKLEFTLKDAEETAFLTGIEIVARVIARLTRETGPPADPSGTYVVSFSMRLLKGLVTGNARTVERAVDSLKQKGALTERGLDKYRVDMDLILQETHRHEGPETDYQMSRRHANRQRRDEDYETY